MCKWRGTLGDGGAICIGALPVLRARRERERERERARERKKEKERERMMRIRYIIQAHHAKLSNTEVVNSASAVTKPTYMHLTFTHIHKNAPHTCKSCISCDLCVCSDRVYYGGAVGCNRGGNLLAT
jgi:hypothetical protein